MLTNRRNSMTDELRSRIENMFFNNSTVSMFKDIIPEILNIMKHEPVNDSLAVQIEDVIKMALLTCKSQGRDFIVYPKLDLNQYDNAMMRITDFVFDDIAGRAVSHISISCMTKDTNNESGGVQNAK